MSSFDYQRGTRERARINRKNVRQDIGTSSSPLPDVIAVLNAARALGALLDNASGGRFGISVYDFNHARQDVGEGEVAIPVGTAIEVVLDARRRERELAELVIERYGSPESREYS